MFVLCSVCICGIFQVCLVDITDLECTTQLKETLATGLSVSENCRFHAAEKEARTVPHLSRFCWVWRLAISINDLFRCDFGIDLLVNLRWKLFGAGVSGLEHAATGSLFYLRITKSWNQQDIMDRRHCAKAPHFPRAICGLLDCNL